MPTPEIPTVEPREFAIGETLVWRSFFADHSPAEGWALTYYFRGPTKFDALAITDPEDADGFQTTVTAEISEKAVAGTYYWQAWLSKGSEKFRLASGKTTAVPGLLAVDGNFDGRSDAKKLLDAINALLAGKATKDQAEYTIGAGGASQQLRLIPIPELLELKRDALATVQGENRRKRKSPFRTIRIAFGRPK